MGEGRAMIWLLSTRAGRFLSAAVAGLVALLGVYAAGRRDGSSRARQRASEADTERAREIEERADEALRRHDGDTRPIDERLRERGRLRD